MARERKRRQDQPAALEMTPMIDVVFQLLIFFIVTLRQEDILSHLDVNRPAPDSKPPPEKPQELLTILVYNEGFVLQGRRISLKDLDRQLTRIAKFSKTISVIIKCTSDSPHLYLMQLLDVCAKAGLKNLNVFSM